MVDAIRKISISWAHWESIVLHVLSQEEQSPERRHRRGVDLVVEHAWYIITAVDMSGNKLFDGGYMTITLHNTLHLRARLPEHYSLCTPILGFCPVGLSFKDMVQTHMMQHHRQSKLLLEPNEEDSEPIPSPARAPDCAFPHPRRPGPASARDWLFYVEAASLVK